MLLNNNFISKPTFSSADFDLGRFYDTIVLSKPLDIKKL